MSRKEFEDFADTLKRIRPRALDGNVSWLLVVQAIANVCRRHGPNFKENIFLNACGYSDQPEPTNIARSLE